MPLYPSISKANLDSWDRERDKEKKKDRETSNRNSKNIKRKKLGKKAKKHTEG